MELFVQAVGLIVALSFVFFSIDDLAWDLASIIYKLIHGERDRLPFEALDSAPPKLLAVMIAAWQEESVIEQVISHMIASTEYPRTLYHIFIGVYPNDEPTKRAASRLGERYENVHIVINAREGPTCKADNLNSIIKFIKAFEQEHKKRFAAITIHDSEDVVHPYELKVTNYLIDQRDALQFPVIPLQKLPRLKDFFRDLTSGTYADEFAENHFRVMGTRDAMTAVVPSAGTGFCLSRKIIESFSERPIFPEDSLTEDYKLSLTLAEMGFKVHFVLEKLPRLTDDMSVRWDYVATRSFFPDRFQTAVKQKTRWIYGITMQSFRLRDVFKKSTLGLVARYSLYKDLKAKLSNLVVIPGYLVFIYFIISLFIDVPYMYLRGTLAWRLCVFLTVMMLLRQLMRAVAVANFYGLRSMAVSCLIPPLVPVRLVWGNIINFTASVRAWRIKAFGDGKGRKKKNKKVRWSKTDHKFLSRHILYRYYRNIGDVLLEKQFVDVSTLSRALEESRKTGQRLGQVLIKKGAISETQLMNALSSVHHRLYVDDLSAFSGSLCSAWDMDDLRGLMAFPLFKTVDYCVIAVTDSDAEDYERRLQNVFGERLYYVYTTESLLRSFMLELPETKETAEYGHAHRLLTKGLISWEQAVIALNSKMPLRDILSYMGVCVSLD